MQAGPSQSQASPSRSRTALSQPQAGPSRLQDDCIEGKGDNLDYGSLVKHPPIPQDVAIIYTREATLQLSVDFPFFQKKDLQLLLLRKNGFYAPTFMACYEGRVNNVPVPIPGEARNVRVLGSRRAVNRNGKNAVIACKEFEMERRWVHEWKAHYDKQRTRERRHTIEVHQLHHTHAESLEEKQNHKALVSTPSDPALLELHQQYCIDEHGDLVIVPDEPIRIECGCCSDDTTDFIDMMQCPDGHLFCKNCVRMQAETVVGNRKTEILCMDQSDCKRPFTRDVLEKCIDGRTIGLWEKLKQAKDIREANIPDLEECPFCDYAMEVPFKFEDLPIFTCEKCEKDSCRRCKKEDHAGELCRDQAEEEKLKKDHVIAEAMTKALLRTCPKCKAPFVKETGCNKMRCSTCGIFSCYVCRKQIMDCNPYLHFNGQGAYVPGKCPLWDPQGDINQRHNAEVAAAEKAARKKLSAAQEAGPSSPQVQIW